MNNNVNPHLQHPSLVSPRASEIVRGNGETLEDIFLEQKELCLELKELLEGQNRLSEKKSRQLEKLRRAVDQLLEANRAY